MKQPKTSLPINMGKLLEALHTTKPRVGGSSEVLKEHTEREELGTQRKLDQGTKASIARELRNLGPSEGPPPPAPPPQTEFVEQVGTVVEVGLGELFTLTFPLPESANPANWEMLTDLRGDLTRLNTDHRENHLINIFRADMLGEFVVTFYNRFVSGSEQSFLVKVGMPATPPPEGKHYRRDKF